MDINGKKVWITGASSGIGEAVAKLFAAEGALLVLSARNEEKLHQLRDSLPNAEQHKVVVLDLAFPETVSQQIEAAIPETGTPDILFNNAGISLKGSARDTKLSVQRQVMEVNYFGTIATTQSLLPAMLQQPNPLIATVSSVAGKVGGQSMSGYSASKHAILGYMDCLRAEEAKNGLKVLNICPGFVTTNISVNAMDANGNKFNQMSDSIKNGISAEECATKILSAIKASKDEIVIGKGISGWAPTIARFFPGLVRKLAAKKNYRQ